MLSSALLSQQQQAYWNSAGNDSSYISGSSGCGNLYSQQLDFYNMKGGSKKRRTRRKTNKYKRPTKMSRRRI
jgi:hypothetical protein